MNLGIIYLATLFEETKMKTINVNINASFIVPDDWDVVEHIPDKDFPDDKLTVLKIGKNYYDFFPECLMKIDNGSKIYWSADEGKTEDVIDCMETFNVQIKQEK